MTPSKELLGSGSSGKFMWAKAYHHSTVYVREWLRRVFQALVSPVDYEDYMRCYEAGRIFGDSVPGPFLAQVIVWKCDSEVHRDQNDEKWCLTFCGGNFKGGVFYFPDLGLRLR